jgi:hypothetical protein
MSQVQILAPHTMKNSVELVLKQLVGGFLGLKQNFLLFFGLFLRILKIQITAGW